MHCSLHINTCKKKCKDNVGNFLTGPFLDRHKSKPFSDRQKKVPLFRLQSGKDKPLFKQTLKKEHLLSEHAPTPSPTRDQRYLLLEITTPEIGTTPHKYQDWAPRGHWLGKSYWWWISTRAIQTTFAQGVWWVGVRYSTGLSAHFVPNSWSHFRWRLFHNSIIIIIIVRIVTWIKTHMGYYCNHGLHWYLDWSRASCIFCILVQLC